VIIKYIQMNDVPNKIVVSLYQSKPRFSDP